MVFSLLLVVLYQLLFFAAVHMVYLQSTFLANSAMWMSIWISTDRNILLSESFECMCTLFFPLKSVIHYISYAEGF